MELGQPSGQPPPALSTPLLCTDHTIPPTDGFPPGQSSVSLPPLPMTADPGPPPRGRATRHSGHLHGCALALLQAAAVFLQCLDAVPDLAPHLPQLEEREVPLGLLH